MMPFDQSLNFAFGFLVAIIVVVLFFLLLIAMAWSAQKWAYKCFRELEKINTTLITYTQTTSV